MKKPAPAHHRREPFLLTQKSDFTMWDWNRREFPLHSVEVNIRAPLDNSWRLSAAMNGSPSNGREKMKPDRIISAEGNRPFRLANRRGWD